MTEVRYEGTRLHGLGTPGVPTTATTGAAASPPAAFAGAPAPGAGDPPARRRPTRWVRPALVWTAVAVTVFGVLVALLAGYLFGFTALQASRAQHQMLAELQPPAGIAALSGRTPADGRPVAILTIPALHLEQAVVEGTSAADLARGPGLMRGSALPGVRGNSVVAGHRLLYGGPFSGLGTLRRGDRIRVTGGLGTFGYRVTSVSVITPGQPDPVVPTADPRLTLLTSGDSLAPDERVAVVAAMVTRPAPVDLAVAVPPRPQVALAGDPGALLPTLGWGALLLAGIGLTLALYRRWRRPWPTYLMTTPVLLALAVLCFENLAHLLPATL